ncbi:MAG TPA: nitroreductase [Bdellovibrionales bacterium]|nr:nitroreductase [Pseudobdellovibrionaceae bacterium]HAG90700.1 nitroreductase [Bdellovibrionales bacterium]|tara:strand:- start:58 stop:603 length:546 start_codon:yes stop_codon:yes gene_type:complete
MNLKELIRSRRTIHQFKDEPVSWDLVEEALELSLWAPNHKLTEPWRYISANPEQRQQLVDLAVDLKKQKESEFSETKEKALRKKLSAPAHWIFLGISKSADPRTFEEDQATMACSVQIISLVLWEKGIGTKWSTGKFSIHPETYKILDISPDEIYLMGVLFIGIPDLIPAPPKKKAPGTFW